MMIPANHTNRSFAVDVIWWIVLVTLAMIVLLVLGIREVHGQRSRSGAVGIDSELARSWSFAVEDYRSGRLASAEAGFESVSDQLSLLPARPPLGDAGLAIWKTLLAQRQDDRSAAIDGWKSVVLPDEMRLEPI